MHRLPAFHNRETKAGGEMFQTFGITEMDAAEDFFEGPANLAFEQAENRMHAIETIVAATLAA